MNRNLLLTCLFICFLPFSISAQKKAGEMYLNLSGGLSFPTKDYAKKQVVSTGEQGFAKQGYQFNVRPELFFDNDFGMSLFYNYTNNPFANEAFADKVAQNNDVDLVSYPDYAYHNHQVYLNLFLHIGISDDLYILGKVGPGLLYSQIAGEDYAVIDKNGEAHDQSRRATGGGLGINIGTGLHYYLFGRFKVILEADYYTIGSEYELKTSAYKFEQTAQFLNISAGISFPFTPAKISEKLEDVQ